VQICAVVTKNESGTKMINFDNCERSEEMRGCEQGKCTREESATLFVVLRSCRFGGRVVVGIQGVERCLKTSV
jgi:hypothetical protein